jgi:hypothetical protein
MTYPIIRVRLYSDIEVIQKVTEYPNDLYIRANMDGGIYRMNDDDKSPVLVAPTSGNITFSMKVYIENKNTPTSTVDQYVNGLKKDDSLNNNVKVPIELYCYNETLIHMMRQRVSSIYKNISLSSVIDDMIYKCGISNYEIDQIHNQNKYDSILIPNLNIVQALAFFDSQYGLYHKGAQLYCELDNLRLVNSDVENGATPIPIYVESAKNNTDMGGMRKLSSSTKKTYQQYQMSTMAGNISVISETDIEKVLNTPNLAAVNANTLDVSIQELKNLYATTTQKQNSSTNDILTKNIESPDIIHKTSNSYIAESYVARLDENITKIDVSGVGFDINRIKVDTRYNLMFASPMRGVNINCYYRATYACHVFTNLDSDLFIAQTTMNLCSN